MDKATMIKVDGRKRINALVFLEDGMHLLSGGEDGTIRQWHVEDRKEIEDKRLTASSAVRALALSGDGNWIISTGLRIVTVWNRRTRQIAHNLGGHSDWVNTVDVSPNSIKFATGSNDNSAVIWVVSNGKQLVKLPAEEWGSTDRAVISVRFSADGQCIAIARPNGIQIHDTYGGLYLWSVPSAWFDLGSRNNPIAWSSDSQHIFALNKNKMNDFHGERSRYLSQWEIPGYSSYQSGSTGLALPRSGKFVASFTCRCLTFWDTSTHVQLGPVFEHLHVDYPYSIALSPDDNYVATGSTDGIIILLNLNDIIPSSLLCHRRLDLKSGGTQAQTPHVMPNTMQSSPDKPSGATTQPDDRPQGKVILQFIPNSVYRIKSNTGDLYLTGPHAGAGAVVVRPLNRSNVFQKWTISLVTDGAYDVVNTSELQLTMGIGAPLLAGQKGTTWTFDPRGDAFVIGNAANTMAIQLEPDSSSVFVFPRNNSVYQRWVLEPVTD